MKLSELWLREWVSPLLNTEQLAERLTMAGLEVDAVTPVAGEFTGVVVGKVLSTKPHPKADKLTLCEVSDGHASLNIVCGATNVCTGLNVALALEGAHLPHDVIIKESMLRGELSQGMLCSLTELGLSEESDGIMELPADAPIGVNLRDYLELNDWILDLDLTPNRADCFSVLGVARDIAALTGSSLKPVPTEVVKPTIDETLTIKLTTPTACPRYAGRIIRNINPHATSPIWMVERLRRSGLRTIHPVVDITNYVMLELGQPMHAFDLNAIEGSISVRWATSDESLDLLDGKNVVLDAKALVIADDAKALAIAGIMGGQTSAVQESTLDIFLESAFFNPVDIGNTARRYGLCTDSSQRFERGVDPTLQVLALERATALLLDIVGGMPGPISVVSEEKECPQKRLIRFNPKKVERVTGLTISENKMLRCLEDLGMRVEKAESTWLVEIPSYRFDLHLDVDLVEEITRLHGYDQLTSQTITTSLHPGRRNPLDVLESRVSQFFTSRGYHETISYSFVDPTLQQELYPNKLAKELLNPISSDLAHMRVGMWPGLLASMIHNIHRQQTMIKLFESGVVFDLDEEHACVAGLLMGEHGTLNWSEKSAKFDFFDAKGELQALFALLQWTNVDFKAAEHTALHPGKSAKIMRDEQFIGWCGVLHPKITDALDINDEVILFELRLEALMQSPSLKYRCISKFPQIRRDLSLLVDDSISVQTIENVVREVVDPSQLKSFDVFDVFKGDVIPEGKKSIALSIVFQDDKRTLIDNEINTIINDIIKKLHDELNITLRD